MASRLSKDYGIHEVRLSPCHVDGVHAKPVLPQVWADNLESEFAALRQAVDQYPFVSMVGSSSSVYCCPN